MPEPTFSVIKPSGIAPKPQPTQEQIAASLAPKTVVAATASPVIAPKPIVPGGVSAVSLGMRKIVLPDDPIPTSPNFEDFTWLIYGPKKIGKTDLSSQFAVNGKYPLHLMFEDGAKDLDIRQLRVPDWEEFLAIKEELRKNKGKYSTCVIDTADLSYDRCFKYQCSRLGITHPTDLGYGKGWDAIKSGYRDEMHDLASIMGGRLILLSHSRESEWTQLGGLKINKIVPSLQNSPQEFFAGFVDIIGCYLYYGKERYMQITGNEQTDAGTRAKKHFWVKDHGPKSEDPQRVEAIWMGRSAEQAYANILRAWNNEQPDNGIPEGEIWGVGDKKVPMAVK
jgi:hypothetical protein